MNLDLDEIFAYTTVKTVKIKDRWLGILHYAAMIGIFIYIVVFTVIIDHGYLYIESPVGNARFTFRRPYLPNSNTINPTPPELLPYCLRAGNSTNATITEDDGCPSVPGSFKVFPNLPCIYWDEDDAVFPDAESNAIMLTTHVSSQVYTLPGCDIVDNFTCDYVTVSPEAEYYISDAESFTLLVDHAMRAPISGKQRNGKFINGKLLRANGKDYPTDTLEPDVEQIAFCRTNKTTDDKACFPTILKLSTVLKAAGIESLDRPSDSSSDCDETWRRTGLVVVLFIRYDNTYSFNENRIHYTLQFQALADTEYKVNQEIYLNPTFNITSGTYDIATSLLHNRHGVRIVSVILGTIGHFEFQTLLLTLVSGMGLLAVSTLIVDLLATSIMPRKREYDIYKTQHTVDFSDLKKGKVTLPPDVEYERRQRYPDATMGGDDL